ncbi:MAG: cation acetate symporter [SAR86 cluster bacterium]|uniref:Cation acetate symporter n=1 Tax=SAR86 cluster bacterium TaxID=2030880 RepID=A0A520MXU4_9GAMM|nr:MAG: cation acetate symporter [SAR86 cluster bacterium]|tara:strand:- start:2947 stop:4695 length:1749 start_codon:yes stop_codon:yes gene_type:complete
MSTQALTYLFVGITFALYIGIAFWSKAKDTRDFYVAGKGVSPLANGMATAADWMSAASFISIAGIIAFSGRDGSVYLMGWTGGYVLLALLLAPYLRKFGKYTVPEFIGTRYCSDLARIVAVLCLIFISFTYIAGQMRGVGIVFSRFLEVDINLGVVIGMVIVFFYAVMGGMKGITYTQVAQYCVLIFAYLVPAIFISILITGNPVPQLGFGSTVSGSSEYLLDKLDRITEELGFNPYTENTKSTFDVICITAALMFGTAGLPHVIVRFFTVPKVKDARKSVGYALICIALLFTTAPAVGAFARVNIADSIQDTKYVEAPEWFKNWENIGLVAWKDKNNDGAMQLYPGNAFEEIQPSFSEKVGQYGERVVTNNINEDSKNELYIDRDIMVLANPEIASLPPWVFALVAAGALAAALSTAAGLLLVISSSISHDLMKKTFRPNITEKQELLYARIAASAAILVAGYFGINPPGFVAQVVALAFGLAASTIFPALLMGIFFKEINKEGAILGMVLGLVTTFSYIIYFKFMFPELNNSKYWLLGISPEGFGVIGMLVNFMTAIICLQLFPTPPSSVTNLLNSIRKP